jgi:hypothetical protein
MNLSQTTIGFTKLFILFIDVSWSVFDDFTIAGKALKNFFLYTQGQISKVYVVSPCTMKLHLVLLLLLLLLLLLYNFSENIIISE